MAKSERSSVFRWVSFFLRGETESRGRSENTSAGPASLQQGANSGRFTLIDKEADSRTAQSAAGKSHHPATQHAENQHAESHCADDQLAEIPHVDDRHVEILQAGNQHAGSLHADDQLAEILRADSQHAEILHADNQHAGILHADNHHAEIPHAGNQHADILHAGRQHLHAGNQHAEIFHVDNQRADNHYTDKGPIGYIPPTAPHPAAIHTPSSQTITQPFHWPEPGPRPREGLLYDCFAGANHIHQGEPLHTLTYRITGDQLHSERRGPIATAQYFVKTTAYAV